MTDDILFSAADGIGTITLNRPRVLNALTPEMIAAMHAQLDAWAVDPAIRAVVLKGEGKAFCAGGDIRAVRQASLDGEHAANARFFETEYDLDHATSVFPKPYVSLIDGVCMGGGMGLSMHAKYRVVTEKAMLAMPETAIGFFPDVGATHALSRLPAGIGMYLGLSGARLSAADALYCGMATHFVPSAELAELEAAIHADPGEIADILDSLPRDAGESELADHRAVIEEAFRSADVLEIFVRLAEDESDWAHQTLRQLQSHAPDAMRRTAALIDAAKSMNLREALDVELATALEMIRTPDFIEGVRAMLVDKDRTPRWTSPAIA